MDNSFACKEMDSVLAHIIKSFCCVSVAALLLNNVSLVQTVASFIPKSVSPKVHTTKWENTHCMRNVHCIECLCILSAGSLSAVC